MIRLFRFLKPSRLPLALVFVLVFGQSFANLYLPNLMADIVDKGIVGHDQGYILRVGGVMLLITIGGMACAISASFFSARIAVGFGRLYAASSSLTSRTSRCMSSTPSARRRSSPARPTIPIRYSRCSSSC